MFGELQGCPRLHSSLLCCTLPDLCQLCLQTVVLLAMGKYGPHALDNPISGMLNPGQDATEPIQRPPTMLILSALYPGKGNPQQQRNKIKEKKEKKIDGSSSCAQLHCVIPNSKYPQTDEWKKPFHCSVHTSIGSRNRYAGDTNRQVDKKKKDNRSKIFRHVLFV